MTAKDILDFVGQGGAFAFAILAVWAFLTEKIVPRGRLDDKEAARKEAIDLAREAITSNERLADAVEARNRLEEARERAEREARR